MEKIKLDESITKSSECLICFDREPNSVFMNCGHGGICYECALDVWKKSSECYLCRKKIDSIYRISDKEGLYYEIVAETKKKPKEKEIEEK